MDSSYTNHQNTRSSKASSNHRSIRSRTYLTVPTTKSVRFLKSLPGSNTSNISASYTTEEQQLNQPTVSVPTLAEPLVLHSQNLPSNALLTIPLSNRPYISIDSTSSNEDPTDFSHPPIPIFRTPRFVNMSSRKIPTSQKEQYIAALRTHQINTLVELRRVEKAFAIVGTPDCSESMTSAWSYYVNSHSLLTELRSLTKNYPFSSDCLNEAKRRVYSDPASNRSWNLCWLVLSKIQNDQLIPYYANHQASQPSMWAGHSPSPEHITQLGNAFTAEWMWAVQQMLRHWEVAPTR